MIDESAVFECPCIAITMTEDEKISITRDIMLKCPIEWEARISNSEGFIVVTIANTKYVLSQYRPALKAYLEGFIVGRNIDYVTYEDFTDYAKFADILKTSARSVLVPFEKETHD